MLQTAYTQHEDEGGNTQLLRKLSNSKWGANASIIRTTGFGIKLLCGRIRGTSLGEAISRPETEYGTVHADPSQNA